MRKIGVHPSRPTFFNIVLHYHREVFTRGHFVPQFTYLAQCKSRLHDVKSAAIISEIHARVVLENDA